MRIDVARPYFDEREQDAVRAVIAGGWVTQGPRVAEFEKEFADYVGARHAVATSSCTTALHAALSLSGIGSGDEVIVPSLSFIATANAVVHCGAVPVFIDIDTLTCNLDPARLEMVITKKTRAIMPVHQMGLPADMDAIRDVAGRYGLLVIEDAACAIGSEYKGEKIGGRGALACFSFHPRKIITTGEGGMITTDDSQTAEKLRRFRHHGMSISDLERHATDKVLVESYPEVGYNYRMTDMQAAMGIAQMKKLPEILARRRSIAKKYSEVFAETPHLRVPFVPGYALHNYQSYWIEVGEKSPVSRDQLMAALLEKGIAARRGIMAIHREPCYRLHNADLPNTERMTANTIILPLYPSMTEEEVNYVIDHVVTLVKG